jgi:2-amino-4-hydroxy-6-hydroxymethyldihydropteridine diphosphokinase
LSAAPAAEPVEVYIGAGSNVEPERHLREACRALAERFGPLRLSPVYRTAAVGFDGDEFLNLVLSFCSDLPPEAIVDELERLHDRAGRVRGPNPFSSRTLDLDLLLYGQAVIPDRAIRVPREDITRYAFVLRPLSELAPTLRHPVSGATMAELWDEFSGDATGMQRVELDLPG